jgi:chromosome segregation ATPase
LKVNELEKENDELNLQIKMTYNQSLLNQSEDYGIKELNNEDSYLKIENLENDMEELKKMNKYANEKIENYEDKITKLNNKLTD